MAARNPAEASDGAAESGARQGGVHGLLKLSNVRVVTSEDVGMLGISKSAHTTRQNNLLSKI